MRKIIFILSLCFVFVACSNNSVPTQEETRVSGSQTTNYPKLKVENKKTNNECIFSIELPNYKIEPLEIRNGESMTFELSEGLWCYENVTVSLRYGLLRSHQNFVYVRKNFADGQTTVITLE